MITMPKELQQAMRASQDQPVRLADPDTHTEYVVQADSLNQRLDDTILALITSSQRRRLGADTQLIIDISTTEGQQTDLRLNSVVPMRKSTHIRSRSDSSSVGPTHDRSDAEG